MSFKKGQKNKNWNGFQKGLIPWNKGTKGIMKAWNKGKPMPEEQKLKLTSLAKLRIGEKNHFYGKHHSEETKKKLRLKCGHIAWNKGKIWSRKIKDKLSKSHIGIQAREKHPLWKGGMSNLEKTERLAGRKRPKQCEICGAFGRICFDHNHETGKFRGWICHRCNVVLGFVKDNAELLKYLSNYIIAND